MKRRRQAMIQDSGVIGWISISEVFLLCGVTMLAVALAIQSKLETTRDELAATRKAESELPQLKEAVAKLERAALRDRRTISELSDRLNQADRRDSERAAEVARMGRELQTAVAERSTLRDAVAALTGERDRLATELGRVKAENGMLRESVAALTGERDRLATELGRVKAENGMLRESVAALTGERDRLSDEMRGLLADLGRSRSENESLRQEIRKLEERLARIDESIVMPLKAARLIVKVRCEAIPAGYDLDLYVQDPHDQVCSWIQPRTLWESRETGLLILSEDLRNVRGTTEEIYYSLTVEPSAADHPYLVSCMLRARSAEARPGPIDVPVRWEVAMAWNGAIEPVGEGVRRIRAAGKVVYANRTYAYPGLVPLTGFSRPRTPTDRPRTLSEAALPKTFRGWSDANVGADASPVVKVRDN